MKNLVKIWYFYEYVAVYTHELFLHEEMMGIKGNTQSNENWTWKLEPWTLRKNWVIVSLKVNIFRKPRITVIGSNQWQVFVISISWVIWEKAV